MRKKMIVSVGVVLFFSVVCMTIVWAENPLNMNELNDENDQSDRDPTWSEEVSSPQAYLEAYFATLAEASHLTPEQSMAAGGTIGMGRTPYPLAYNFWSKEWQSKHTYEAFLDSWSGTAHVELLKMYEANTRNGAARFFVETKHLEAVGKQYQLGEFYYTGFFSVEETEEGWKITEGGLEPQNLAWKFGGHQPWLTDPIQVATVHVHGLGKPFDDDHAIEPEVIHHTDDYVTVQIFDDNGNVEAAIELARPKDGIWKVIAIEREIPFSFYTGPSEDGREIVYTAEEKQAIHEWGQTYGIEPLIPMSGVATDYLMEVRLKKNAMKLIYPHFGVSQSNRDFVEPLEEETVKTVTLHQGQTAQWFPEQRILYVHMNDVYIAISSAKSVEKEDLIRIAQSFTPALSSSQP